METIRTDALGGDVRLEELPTPPGVALEIIRLASAPDTTPAEMATVLSRDPVLAARLLSVANSPMHARGNRVTSIERAVALLGVKAVKLMALSFSLADDWSRGGDGRARREYWFRSLMTAAAARRWASVLGSTLLEEAFLCGLVSHLGRLILSRQVPDRYADLVVEVGSWPTEDAERAALGVASSDVTVAVLRHWGLPETIVDVVERVVDDWRAVDHSGAANGNGPAGTEALVGAVALGWTSQQALHPQGAPNDVLRLHQAAEAHGIAEDAFDELVLDMSCAMLQMGQLLEVDLPDMTSDQILQEARAKLVAVSIETALQLEAAELDADRLRLENNELGLLARRDRLTGLANRGVFDDHLSREIAARVRQPDLPMLGLVIIDIDHFKDVNDTYGHQVGDDVLRMVGGRLQYVCRADELAARYGGEEFAVVLRLDDVASLRAAAERLRESIETLVIATNAGAINVTVSVGASVLRHCVGPTDAIRLIGSADRALYMAKHAGRNRVVVSDDAVEGVSQ